MKTDAVGEGVKSGEKHAPGLLSTFMLHPSAFYLPALALATPLAAPFTWRYSHVGTLGGMAASHAAFCYASLRANCQWVGPVATRFVPEGNEVWLTIDDGPSPDDTPRLLDLLDASGAKATFFVRGDRAEAHPELIREIVWRGHGVANHTYSHPQYSFWCAPPWRVATEIDRCSEVLRDLTGQRPRWFRAPVGMANPFVHPAVRSRDLRLVGWSRRGLDTLSRATPESVTRRILHGLQPGGIVLLHEGRQNAADQRINVQAMQMLLTVLAERGWRAIVPDDSRLR